MIVVTKIDEKNFTVNENGDGEVGLPAVYEAMKTEAGTVVLRPRNARNGRSFQAQHDAWEINGVVPSSALEAQQLLNEFVGNFKSGAGTPGTNPSAYCAEKIIPVAIASGVAKVDLSADGKIYVVTPSAATTIEVTNATIPADTMKTFEVHIVMASAVAITWFSGITWIDGSAPTLAAGTSVCVFRTTDGINFIGNLAYVY